MGEGEDERSEIGTHVVERIEMLTHSVVAGVENA